MGIKFLYKSENLRHKMVLLLILSISTIQPSAVYGSQAASNGAAASTNNTANMLAKGIGVVSMALGGLTLGAGAAQMACCSSGCTGAGDKADKNTDQIKDQQDKAIERLPWENNGKPSGAILLGPLFISKCQQNTFNISNLFSLFQPTPIYAASVTPCLDAAIAMAKGGLMLLQGMMGLQAAMQAGNNAKVANANQQNMAGVGRGVLSGNSNNDVKIDPALLRNGTADSVMGQFEKKFGIGRDAFASAVQGGQDPRSILTKAPLNAISTSDMNKAIGDAQNLSEEEKKTAMAESDLEKIQRELAASLNGGAGGTPKKFMASDYKPSAAELDSLTLPEPAAAPALDANVSPEIQAALAAREMDLQKEGITNSSLFQIVHKKYEERIKMIYGGVMPSSRGIANTNGF